MACGEILIVEDDEDIRSTLREVLEIEGYVVHTAAHGQEGLDVLETIGRPCVVLLDMMMPVMNGWEFISALEAKGTLGQTPVVVVSAAGERARAPQAVEYVRKPIDLESLLQTIERYC